MNDGAKRGRIALLGLAALFFVPMMVAGIWYLNLDRFGAPDSVGAKGELVTPAMPLPGFTLPRVDAAGTVDLDTLRGSWTLVYIGGSECDDACRERLYYMRQVRLAMGVDMGRVQRLYLLVDEGPLADPEFFAREHEGMKIARIDPGHTLLALFSMNGESPAPGRTWIVDPLGNLMLSYPRDSGGRAMLDDLKRLLRLSRVG